ncbi:MAG: EAL and HDOD domain-containing protein [Pseudomonadales bacterium]
MSHFHIGRQPIFDQSMNIFAYELLFRSGSENAANVTDADYATSTVILNAFTEIGIDKLVGSRPAFINMPYNFLARPDMVGFPPQQVVLEILEDVVIDEALIDGVREMSAQGYIFALDDFIFSEQWQPLIDLATIIKFDVTQLDEHQLRDQVQMMQDLGKQTLAERIETQGEYDDLRQLGFDYYQGYFFAKPRVISGNRVPLNKLGMIELLARINEPDATISSISELVSADVALSLKTMKFINSPITGLRNPVENIQQAVIYLGFDTLKSWLTVMTLGEMNDKPEALINLALTRARMCQLLASTVPSVDPQAAFTAGLFSLLDTMLDSSMEEVLKTISLADIVSDALLHKKGELGALLRQAIELEQPCNDTELPVADVSKLQLEAIQWADAASNHEAAA